MATSIAPSTSASSKLKGCGYSGMNYQGSRRSAAPRKSYGGRSNRRNCSNSSTKGSSAEGAEQRKPRVCLINEVPSGSVESTTIPRRGCNSISQKKDNSMTVNTARYMN